MTDQRLTEKQKQKAIDDLIDGLLDQMNRVKELKKHYEKLPDGGPAVAMISDKIEETIRAMAAKDTARMLLAYQRLEKLK